MGLKDDKSCLGYLGAAYQYNLVKSFIEDKEFFKSLNEIIDQNAFTEPVLKHIVAIMRNHYNKYGSVPGYDLIGIELRDSAHTEHDREVNMAVLERMRNTTLEAPDLIMSKGEKFFKQQNLVKAANTILQIAGNGDASKYDECKDILDAALKAGRRDRRLYRVFDDYEDTLAADYRSPIPTGIGKLDETLEGGLGAGELACIIGPSGYGKTTLTTAIASTAATTLCESNNYKGYKVLQVVFEDNPKQMRRKHMSRIAQTEARCLSHEDCIEHVRELTDPKLQNNRYIQDNIIIAKFASGEHTVGDIANLIKELTNEGFKTDVLILDYFECLKLERGFDNDKWDAEGKTMRKLESITGELGLATWVTTQGTKKSLNVDIVTLDKAGGSFKQVQIAHIVVSISRTLEDIDNNIAKMTILKNRAGKSGKTFDNVYFNNGTCTINTDTCTEFNSIIDYGREQKQTKEAMAAEIFKNAKAQRQASRQIGAREDEEF